MNYGYGRGLGALGWDKSWHIPMGGGVARNVSCAGGGTLTCATDSEHAFMVNQSCVPSVYPANGLDACTTGSGSNGTLYCCPAGRPGTRESPGGTVGQIPANSRDITALQNFIIGQGCSVGSTGADGIFGRRTREGLDCAIERTSYVNVVGRFPFVTTLIATPTGQERPPNFTFDPGMTAKTPEQMVASGSRRVSSSGSTQRDMDVDRERREQAGIIAGLPWWGWALIGVGGLAFLGIVGAVVAGDEPPDRRGKPRRRYYEEDDDDIEAIYIDEYGDRS